MKRCSGPLGARGPDDAWCGLQVSGWCSGTDLDPLLLVQVGDVELLAGRVRQHLVVLLEDLVEALQASTLPVCLAQCNASQVRQLSVQAARLGLGLPPDSGGQQGAHHVVQVHVFLECQVLVTQILRLLRTQSTRNAICHVNSRHAYRGGGAGTLLVLRL